MKKLITILFAALILTSRLPADGLALSFFQHAMNNLFQNRFAQADDISSLSASWEKSLGSFSLFADGGYSYLRRNSGLSYGSIIGGADTLLSLNDKTVLYVSLDGGAVLYRSDFNDFNYRTVRLTVAAKSYIRPTSILKASAVVEYKKYRSSPFDYASSAVQVSLDKFFPSKTTFKADLSWRYKFFLHPLDVQTGGSDMTGNDASGVGPGTAMGGGMGMDMNQGGGHGSYFLSGTTQEGRGIQIAALTGIIAQGVGDRLGLRLAGTRQWTLSGKNPFASIEEFYWFENPTYDLFSWEGFSLNAQLTLEIPWDVELKTGYTISRKSFPGIENLGTTETGLTATREDTRRQLEFKFEKNFSRLSVFLTYAAIRNASNDTFFDWRGQTISGGLEWNFFFSQKK